MAIHQTGGFWDHVTDAGKAFAGLGDAVLGVVTPDALYESKGEKTLEKAAAGFSDAVGDLGTSKITECALDEYQQPIECPDSIKTEDGCCPTGLTFKSGVMSGLGIEDVYDVKYAGVAIYDVENRQQLEALAAAKGGWIEDVEGYVYKCYWTYFPPPASWAPKGVTITVHGSPKGKWGMIKKVKVCLRKGTPIAGASQSALLAAGLVTSGADLSIATDLSIVPPAPPAAPIVPFQWGSQATSVKATTAPRTGAQTAMIAGGAALAAFFLLRGVMK